MEKIEMFDITSETLFIGCLYKNPILFVDYAELVKSKYDFYYKENEFLYRLHACFLRISIDTVRRKVV